MMFYWFLKYFQAMNRHYDQKMEISNASPILTNDCQIQVFSQLSNYYCTKIVPLDCQIKRVKSNKCVKNHTSLWPSLMHSTALCVKNHQSKLRKMLGFHKYAFLDESVRRQFSNQKRETYQFKKCDKMYRWFLNILQIKVIVVL